MNKSKKPIKLPKNWGKLSLTDEEIEQLPEFCVDPSVKLPSDLTKKCGSCGKTYIMAMFARDRSKASGRDAYCIKCRKEKRKQYTLNYNSDNNEGTRRQKMWKFGKKIGKDKYLGWKNFKSTNKEMNNV